MKFPILTILIPTYNRSARLAANLDYLYEVIHKGKHLIEVAILVSDNQSDDETKAVCLKFSEKCTKSGLNFTYSQNESNLGFSWNVIEGYFKAKSKYTLFLSDDDNLESGFLNELLSDINQYKFSLGIYNFSQPPFDANNLLIQSTNLFRGEHSLEKLVTLIKWPKLSGIVLRNDHEIERQERIKSRVAQNNVVGHVLLALDQIMHDPILLMSSTIAAYPDEDFRDHVNFVGYIGNYIKRDILQYCDGVGIQNDILKSEIEAIPTRNIVLFSLQTLSLYYKSQIKLNRKMRNEVFKNIYRHLIGFRASSTGLSLEKPYKSFSRVKTLVYLGYLGALAFNARISRKKLYLMDEVF